MENTQNLRSTKYEPPSLWFHVMTREQMRCVTTDSTLTLTPYITLNMYLGIWIHLVLVMLDLNLAKLWKIKMHFEGQISENFSEFFTIFETISSTEYSDEQKEEMMEFLKAQTVEKHLAIVRTFCKMKSWKMTLVSLVI